MSCFLNLVKKDLLDHAHGGRLRAGALICLLLFGLTALIRFRDVSQAHQERSLFLQRWIGAVEEQAARNESIQVENTRSVSPLGVLSMGLEPVMPFRMSSTKEGLRLGESRAAKSSVDALFGYLDLSFCIGALLSLLSLAFSFDALCGERSQGTLAMVLSYPVSRNTVLLAKITANTLATLVCLLPAFLVVFGMALLHGVPLVNPWHWLVFLAISSIYLYGFVAIGTALSAWVRRPADAMLACLLTWVLLAFVLPRAMGLVVNALRPPAKAIELALQEDQQVSQLRTEFKKKQQEAFLQFAFREGAPGAQEDFRNRIQQATQQYTQARRQILDRLWEAQGQEERLREQTMLLYSGLSPTALYQGIAAELAWTGHRQREHFILEARSYDEKIGRKLADSRQVFYAPSADGRTGKAMVQNPDIKPYLVPFGSTWVSSRQILASIAWPVFALILFGVGFTVIGLLGLNRMDVRP